MRIKLTGIATLLAAGAAAAAIVAAPTAAAAPSPLPKICVERPRQAHANRPAMSRSTTATRRRVSPVRKHALSARR